MTVTDLAVVDLPPAPRAPQSEPAVGRVAAFPTPLGWAATFDPALVHEMAAAVACSVPDVGVQPGLVPVLDVCRDPRWGRTEETLGQDPFLVAVLGAAYSAGLASGGAATTQHVDGCGCRGFAADLRSPWLRSLAARMAERSIVLLDNASGFLPVPAPRSVAVLGPCADELRSLLARARSDGPGVRPPEVPAGVHVDSLLQALRQEWPMARITHAAGVPAQRADTSGVAAATALAAAAEVCVLAVGDVSGLPGRGTSGEGCDASDLRLPGAQHDLVEAVLGTGTPTVLVLLSGRPYALGEYVGRAAAVVQAFFPGQLGASAVAGVLSGLVNPSGRLPVELPTTRYAFGHGLSYTRFTLSDLTVDTGQVPADGQVSVRLLVTNDGDRSGEDVVQLYAADGSTEREADGGAARPERRLVGFARVPLTAGQTRAVTFTLPVSRFGVSDCDLRRVVEPGRFDLYAADTSGVAQHGPTTSFTVVGPPRFVGPECLLGPTVTLG